MSAALLSRWYNCPATSSAINNSRLRWVSADNLPITTDDGMMIAARGFPRGQMLSGVTKSAQGTGRRRRNLAQNPRNADMQRRDFDGTVAVQHRSCRPRNHRDCPNCLRHTLLCGDQNGINIINYKYLNDPIAQINFPLPASCFDRNMNLAIGPVVKWQHCCPNLISGLF